MVFCDIHVPGRSEDPRAERGLLGLPSIAFLDADGVVVQQVSPRLRSVPGFAAVGERAAEFVSMRARDAAGDEAVGAAFLIRLLEERMIDSAAALDRNRALTKVTDAQRSRLDALLFDLEIQDAMPSDLGDLAARRDAGRQFLAWLDAGREPSELVSRGLYWMLMEYGEHDGDPRSYQIGLRGMLDQVQRVEPDAGWVDNTARERGEVLDRLQREQREHVVLREDFAAFDPKRWDELSGYPDRVEVTDGGVPGGDPDGRCLRVTATLGEDTGGHLYKMLEPGLETCHLRFYVRFEPEHEYVHHFVHLVGYSPPTRWPQGGAGDRPAGDQRFSTGIEPWGNWGRHPPPGVWNFYSYWCEMAVAPDGHYWGNSFVPEPLVPVVRDRWTCVEIRLQANTIGAADGEQAVWIDGREIGRFRGIRWRTDPQLNVNGVWILDYITEQPARHNHVTAPRSTNRVWFDEIVVSSSYIGPLAVTPR